MCHVSVGPGMAIQLWWDVDGRDGEKATDNGMGRQNQTKPERWSRCIHVAVALRSKEAVRSQQANRTAPGPQHGSLEIQAGWWHQDSTIESS